LLMADTAIVARVCQDIFKLPRRKLPQVPSQRERRTIVRESAGCHKTEY